MRVNALHFFHLGPGFQYSKNITLQNPLKLQFSTSVDWVTGEKLLQCPFIDKAGVWTDYLNINPIFLAFDI